MSWELLVIDIGFAFSALSFSFTDSVGSTTALLTFSLMSSLISSCSQIFARSLPNATLAFAVLAVTSSSVYTALERVLPKQVNLSTTFSFCPFVVMFGSLYGFPGAGWCTTSVFCEIIVIT